MRVAPRPAIPVALPRAAKANRGRVRRLLANTATVLAAGVAIMVVALSAVVLGLT